MDLFKISRMVGSKYIFNDLLVVKVLRGIKEARSSVQVTKARNIWMATVPSPS